MNSFDRNFLLKDAQVRLMDDELLPFDPVRTMLTLRHTLVLTLAELQAVKEELDSLKRFLPR